MVRRTLVVCLILAISLAAPPRVSGAAKEEDRLFLVGSQAFADGLWDLSSRFLERFLDRSPADPRAPDARILLGKALMALGKPDQALNHFRRVDPGAGERVPEAFFWQGEALFKLKRFNEAQGAYESLLAYSPGHPLAEEARYALAWSLMEQGKNPEAAEAFRQVLKAAPEGKHSPSAAYYLAREYVLQKRWDEAQAILSSYPSRFPKSEWVVDARYLSGWVALQQGSASVAISGFREFLRYHKDSALAPQAQILLAQTLAQQGQAKDAMAEYRAFVQSYPKDPAVPRALFGEGAMALEIGRVGDAESAWRRLRQGFPSDPLGDQASLRLAAYRFGKGQYRAALAEASRAADARDPAVATEAHRLAGESYLKLNSPRQAVGELKQALQGAPREEPERYRILSQLGLAHETLKEWAEAVRAYGSVVEEAHDAELVEWARQRLASVKAKQTPPKSPAKSKSPKRRP